MSGLDPSQVDLGGPKKERRATFIGLALLGAVVVVGALSLFPPAADGEEVRITEAQKRSVTSHVLAQGRVRARRQVDVQSEVSGRVIEIFVRTGMHVVPGSPLFALDPVQAQNAVAQLRVALRSANASVARMNLSVAEAARGLARDQRLVTRGVATQELARTSEARKKLAETDLLQAQANRDRARLEFKRAQDALKKNQVLAPIAGTVVAVGIEIGQLVAPLASTGFSSGTMFGGGGGSTVPHVVIADLSELEARLDVDELDISRVVPGQHVQIRAQGAQRDALVGTVTEVGLLGQRSGGAVMFPVEVSIVTPSLASTIGGGGAADVNGVDVDGGVGGGLSARSPERPRSVPRRSLRPGMTVSANIEVERLASVIAVPLAAVLEGDGEKTSDRVFVASDIHNKRATAKERKVVLGATEDDVVAILSGLSAGESVVEGPFRALRALEDDAALQISEVIPLPLPKAPLDVPPASPAPGSAPTTPTDTPGKKSNENGETSTSGAQ